MKHIILAVLLLMVTAVFAATAEPTQFLRWLDADGGLHFADNESAVP
ncbi:hypothetical protein LCGC14_2276040, partial [marine sediment metagenome]